MDLIVTFETGDKSSQIAPPHCFISLPTAIAASLSAVPPFASLTVVRLVPAAPSTAPPAYVAWAAATIPSPDSLAIHPAFAALLRLAPGHLVRASIVERIANRPRRSLISASLRPVSYDVCTAPSPSHDAFRVAARHFAILTATAAVIEHSLLAQIRVIYHGLVFPLQLPAAESVNVCVVSVHAEGDQLPYALLTPSSQLVVESPPVKPNPQKLFRFFRAFPITSAKLGRLPPFFRTHAVLPLDGTNETRFAYVSRKRCSMQKTLALPVAFRCHQAIPKRHAWLPSHICYMLHLTPFEPLLIEEVSPFLQGASNLLAEPHSFSNHFPSFSEITKASTPYFSGMPMRGLVVNIPKTGHSPFSTDYLPDWDKPGLQRSTAQIDLFEDLQSTAMDSTLSKEARVFSSNKRLLIDGFCSFPDQNLRLVQSADGFVPDPPARHAKPFLPLVEDEERHEKLFRNLTKSASIAIHAAILCSRSLFAKVPQKRQRQRLLPVAVVVQGSIGTGKTHICTTVASLLRDFARVRTIWVRCKVHANEDVQISCDRIKVAFKAAIEGGPGLIVFDEIDSWIQSSQATSAEEMNSGAKDIRGKRISLYLENELLRPRSEPTMILMSCHSFKNLDETIRAPGLVHSVLSVPLTNSIERSFLYCLGLEDYANSNQRDFETWKTFCRRSAITLGKLTDGFSPYDIEMSLARTNIRTRALQKQKVPIEEFVGELRRIISGMVPVSRTGIKFSKPKSEERMSWKSLGGLKCAKNEIWEALQLPFLHPSIFKNAPLRLPHGILLYGPPGCGKTFLARVAAAESQLRCIIVKGPELISKYVGGSEAEVRRAFEKASQAAPCVLLFDEFDALAPKRGGYGTGVSDRVVNTLLTSMDGAERLADGVYILATTSRPEVIDPALLRPGRLDKWISVDIPSTVEDRLDILRCLRCNYFNASAKIEESLQRIAEGADGYTGADLGSVINDAYIAASKRTGTSQTSPGSISEELDRAFSESRPSISKSQRQRYAQVMSKFSGDAQDVSSSLNMIGSEDVRKQFGSLVALK